MLYENHLVVLVRNMPKKLNLAFALFEYVPFGGMQKDLLRIARECLARGHLVKIYAGLWEGKQPPNISVTVIPVKGIANHRRCKSFSDRFMRLCASMKYDLVVGFNKMPGLDVYFCADTCFAAKARCRFPLYRFTSRCRTYLDLERSVFRRNHKTWILMLSERERDVYKQYYDTDDDRFFLIPPGISKDCILPDNAHEIRRRLRKTIGISEEMFMILMVGSHFRTKGVDRSIRALASLPTECRERSILVVVGDDRQRPFERLANRYNVKNRLLFMGGKENVNEFFFAADLLLHPSYRENTGAVLVEAMAAGLPVLATDVCGYGSHVMAARAGRLIPSPFRQKTMNEMLAQMLLSDSLGTWSENGRKYVHEVDVFSLPQAAANVIEQAAVYAGR